MSYVDIGWPAGLVLIAFNIYRLGNGLYIRKVTAALIMLIHGGRMFLGAMVMFFPYTFPKGDLARYKYAKVRWLKTKGGAALGETVWPLKAQIDTAQQCFANSCVLCIAPALAAFNPSPKISYLEVVGVLGFFACAIGENMADAQKARFLSECVKIGKELKGKNEAARAKLKKAVLGFTAPFNTSAYSLWRKSRHPNYFFEFFVWISLSVFALPSVFYATESPQWQAFILFTLLHACRLFYDCLMYWTGAEPAEHFSVQKRPDYKAYQACTNVLFPFDVPFFDHHREPGWPHGAKVH